MRTPTYLSFIFCASIACGDSDPATTPDTTNEVAPEVTEEAEVAPETTEEAEVAPEATEETAEVAPETVVEVDATEEIDDATGPSPGLLNVQVRPLVEEVADACYDLRVQAVGGEVLLAAGDPAFATATTDVEDPDDDDRVGEAIARGATCASAWGGAGGNGAITRVVECTPGVSYDVTVWVHNLYTADGELGDTLWSNACGAGQTLPGSDPADWDGGCTTRVKCPDAGTTMVPFDLALTRTPGGFD